MKVRTKEYCPGSNSKDYHFIKEQHEYGLYDKAFCDFCNKLISLKQDTTLRSHGRFLSCLPEESN